MYIKNPSKSYDEAIKEALKQNKEDIDLNKNAKLGDKVISSDGVWYGDVVLRADDQMLIRFFTNEKLGVEIDIIDLWEVDNSAIIIGEAELKLMMESIEKLKSKGEMK